MTVLVKADAIRKNDLSVDDLARTGGIVNPQQSNTKCPAGFKLNKQGNCVPAKSDGLVQKPQHLPGQGGKCPPGHVRRNGRCVAKESTIIKSDDWKTVTETVERNVRIKKVDEEKRLVFGEVFAPFVPDTQGDFMTDVEIEKMAHNFLRARRQKRVDEQHDNEEVGAVVVESFISRDNDPDFPIQGAWVVGVHVPKDEVWKRVKDGTLNGFSMEAVVTKRVREVVIELEEQIIVPTGPGPDGHTHEVTLKFDESGNFLGGFTNVVDEHWHDVTRNTVTGPEINKNPNKPSDKHAHRYSFVEFLHIIPDIGDTVGK